MARYPNVPPEAILAINRMTAVTEKEKRLISKALDHTVSNFTGSPGIDDNATETQITIEDTEVTFEDEIIVDNYSLTTKDLFKLHAADATTPTITFDTTDRIEYDRVNDKFSFYTSDVPRLVMDQIHAQWGAYTDYSGYTLCRGITSGSLTIGGGEDQGDGANLTLIGSTGSPANDVRFRSGLTTVLQYDDSEDEWDFQDNDIVTTGNITTAGIADEGSGGVVLTVRNLNSTLDSYLTVNKLISTGVTAFTRDVDDELLIICGGSQQATGSYLTLFGTDDSSYPSDVILGADGVAELWYHDSGASANTWDFQGNDIVTSGHAKASDLVATSDIIQASSSSTGYKVGDETTSDWGWRDLEGPIVVRGVGGASPTWAQIDSTGIWDYQFAVNDECWINFHLPHDYVPGSDVYIHAHWLTNGTQTNTVKWQWDYAYADGYASQAFPLGSLTTITAEGAATGTAYTHEITESIAIDGSGWEVDGLLKVHIKRITNGATENTDNVFLLTSDIHYQSTNVPTKNKNANFYT